MEFAELNRHVSALFCYLFETLDGANVVVTNQPLWSQKSNQVEAKLYRKAY